MPAPEEPPPRSATESPPRPPKSGFLDKAAYIAAPGTVAIGLLYYFGNVYQRAYYTALGVIPEDLQFSVQAMLAKSPDAIFLPLWFLLVCGLIVLLVLGWAGQSLSGPRHAARRSKVILWLLGSGLVLLLLGFPVFFWEKNLPTLPGGWVAQFVPAMLVALGATLAFFAVQLRLTHDGETHDRPGRTGDRLWQSGGALLLGLLTMTLFFTMARYASMAGVSNAVAAAQDHYRKSQHVVVHGRRRLGRFHRLPGEGHGGRRSLGGHGRQSHAEPSRLLSGA
ncbi:hypothetical protein ABZW44_22025 [Streptomyces mirabilis]|uniref:hypothetical protein n=1 Tax=Streptomyces mirabilis TaxID=68239 RepID=UPI0033BD40DC